MHSSEATPGLLDVIGVKPMLTIKHIGLASRTHKIKDKRHPNGFAPDFVNILREFDAIGCDTVIFSSYTLPLEFNFPLEQIQGLKNICAIFFEKSNLAAEKSTSPHPNAKRSQYFVFHKTQGCWDSYSFRQQFGKIRNGKYHNQPVEEFVEQVIPTRVMGNACVLLCGEINSVKYNTQSKQIDDAYGLLRTIPKTVKFVINPSHDKMIRFEMKKKRDFLSKDGRVLVAVWNRGKVDRNGRSLDGTSRPWIVFSNGIEVELQVIESRVKGVELTTFSL